MHYIQVHSGISRYTTAQKMKFSIKDYFSKCDQILRNLRKWSHLLTKSLMQKLIFCAVYSQQKNEVSSFFCFSLVANGTYVAELLF